MVLLMKYYQKAGLLQRLTRITKYLKVINLVKKVINFSESLDILIKSKV